MIDELLRLILLVVLFKPPEEFSAAVTVELLYYYAMAHQDSFDVRWIPSVSLAELIAPLAERLLDSGLLTVLVGTSARRLNFDQPCEAIRSVEVRCKATGRSSVVDDMMRLCWR